MNDISEANLPYDPNLKTAVLEIQEIFEKYSIGGSVALSSKTHAEYFNYFPKWCAVQFDKKAAIQPAIRVKSRKKDFKSKKEQHRIMESSAGFVANIRDIAAQTFSMFDKIFKSLEKHMEIDHQPFSNHTQHFEH